MSLRAYVFRILAGLGTLSAALSCVPCMAEPADAPVADVVARLKAVVQDRLADREQRISACVALSQEEYRDQAKETIPAMVSFLETLAKEYPSGQSPYCPTVGGGLEKVTRALGNMGEQAEPAVAALSTILKDQSLASYKRSAAAEALGKIGSSRGVPILVDVARRERNTSVHQAVVSALKQLAPKFKEAAVEVKVLALIDADNTRQGQRQSVSAKIGER
jgi:HEAT repeat protein